MTCLVNLLRVQALTREVSRFLHVLLTLSYRVTDKEFRNRAPVKVSSPALLYNFL